MVEDDPGVVTYRRKDTKKTPLHHAVTYRKIEVVEFLIEHGADVNAIDWTGMTPLHIAAVMNRIAEAKALVRAGANVEAADKFGDRPLHSAALHGQIGMIDYLVLEANAIRDKRNIENLTPAELALKERKPEAAKRLNELGDQESPKDP
jgi:ankyrin repeat protein